LWQATKGLFICEVQKQTKANTGVFLSIQITADGCNSLLLFLNDLTRFSFASKPHLIFDDYTLSCFLLLVKGTQQKYG